ATKDQTFHDKFVEIQQVLKANKDNYNAFGKYSYRSAESILESVKPLAHERGLSLKVTEDLVNMGDRFYIKSTAILSDGVNNESATAYAREGDNQAGMSASQITGSTSSYAKKYSL